MEKFKGKTALITGASSGIGKAIAEMLAAQGTDLILVARREDKLRKLASDLEHKFGIKAKPIVKDLSEENAAEALFSQTNDMGLGVDILINNAGIGYQGDYLDASLEDHRKVIALNMSAVNDLTYLFAKEMSNKGSGYIMLVGSLAGFMPIPRFATYAASKAYVVSLAQSIGKELKGRGVVVTALCPGGTSTEFFDNSGQNIDGIRSFGMMTSEAVAKAGLEGMARHQRLVIPGTMYKLAVFGMRFIPRSLQGLFGQMATD